MWQMVTTSSIVIHSFFYWCTNTLSKKFPKQKEFVQTQQESKLVNQEVGNNQDITALTKNLDLDIT